MRQKRPQVCLDQEAYRKLTRKILDRDGWRCQQCGSSMNLQVHHMTHRGQLGDDAEENLITLCSTCHQLVHWHSPASRPILSDD
jgi:5-methylcytosine-specific restriction endonuclease McrA